MNDKLEKMNNDFESMGNLKYKIPLKKIKLKKLHT